MKLKLPFLALAASLLAAAPGDRKALADLYRKREEVLPSGSLSEEDEAGVSGFLRACEVAVPTADAAATADRLNQALEKQSTQGYSFDKPNGPEGNAEAPPADQADPANRSSPAQKQEGESAEGAEEQPETEEQAPETKKGKSRSH